MGFFKLTQVIEFFSGRIANLVRQEDKSFLVRIFVHMVRKVAKFRMSTPLLAKFIWMKVVPLGSPSNEEGGIVLLVLNEERFRADWEVLARRSDVTLMSLPSAIQHLVNAVWVSELREISMSHPNAYLKNEHPSVKRVRYGLHTMLVHILRRLKNKLNIDGIVTCSYYYRQDRDWESAATEAGISFFTLNKEIMKDPVIHEATISRYKSKGYKFNGTKLLLGNRSEKNVILKAGCATEDQVSIVGSLRMDTLFARIQKNGDMLRKDKVVLFSTHHRSGLLELKGVTGLFNSQRDAGFVKHFDTMHGEFARFAISRPDVEFVIKTKWGGNWREEVRAAIRRVLEVEIEDISNLTVTHLVPAQDLIESSLAVVGLNSTTLLEARLANVPTIIALFEEAADKYFATNVYFQKYLDVFSVARTPREMTQFIGHILDGKLPNQAAIPDAMIKDYLGFFDGRVADRVTDVMRHEINRVS
ncbi:MAG: hypothetical protein P8N92_01175 [Burkholderiales bacterium]|nr:hypothetical protein [Burkholderiales bacterium]